MDNTAQYRHGVLIGNWNEDKFGVQLSNQQGPNISKSLMYESVQKASYRGGSKEALTEYYESKVMPDSVGQGVQADMLFPHNGADTQDTRYQTTYNSTWNTEKGKPIQDPSLRQGLYAKKQQQWNKEQSESSRCRTYETEYSKQQNPGATTMSLPITDNPNIRRGVLERVFDSPHTALRLRKDA